MTATIDQIATQLQGPVFTAPLAEFTEALDALAIAVPTRPAVPLLGGVLITQDQAGVRLSTFDYETSVSVQLDAQPGAESRTVLVGLHELRKVVKAATKGETARSTASWTVELTSRTWDNESDVEVTVGGFTVPVVTLPARDYPNLPAPADTTFTIDRDEFLERLGRTVVAAGDDDTLPMLTGVQCELKAGVLSLASTDRFRLSATSSSVDGDASGSWLIRARSLVTLVKALPAGPVQIGAKSATWTLRSGGVVATQRLLEAEFPKWRQLMRTEHQTVVSVNRANLVRAVSKVIAIGAAVADATGYAQLVVSDDELVVSPHFSEAAQQGRVRGHALAATVDGPEIVFGHTAKYLLEALQSLAGETVFIGLATPLKPILFANSAGDLASGSAAHRHLVMPARLN